MTKSELINELYDRIKLENEKCENEESKVKLRKEDSKIVVNTILDIIMEILRDGKSVELIGFGNFSVVNREAREAKNPQTGETIMCKASKAPKFRAGNKFKDFINQ